MTEINFAPLVDALAIPLAVGHAFGRLGCFMNGCCYGLECTLPWGIRPDSPPEVAGRLLYPTQLYEFFGLLLIAAGLFGIEKIPRYNGQVAGTYCLLYSVLRFIVEFYRGDVPHNVFGRFTLAQVVCVFVFIAAWLISARQSYKAALLRRKAMKANA
jgi:phosphatidylglycerol:prolipoprotein diacylglycerol transferase